MSYHDLLYRYGVEQESGEIRPCIHIQAPHKLATPEEVARRDGYAAQDIEMLETIIENLRDYRKALAARYAELETMPYTRLLKLERCTHWKGHIEYVVTITRTYPDKTEVKELREVFPGKERKKAFTRTNELLKQFPGIPYMQDTEKRSWEK